MRIVGLNVNLMQVWSNLIPKCFVKFIREIITTKSLIIHHGEDDFLEVY